MLKTGFLDTRLKFSDSLEKQMDRQSTYFAPIYINDFFKCFYVTVHFSLFQMVNAVTDIQEDTTVEIVVKVQHLDDEEVEIRPHSLVVHSYKTPTFCHYCGEMLFGK